MGHASKQENKKQASRENASPRRAAKPEPKESGTPRPSKRSMVAVAIFAVLVLFSLAFSIFAPKPDVGAKTVTLQVVDDRGGLISYEIHTDAEYLRQALEETEGLSVDGTESQYGLMIESVNGLTADWNADHAYWCIYVNDERAEYGVDSLPVRDGDVFRLQYTTDSGDPGGESAGGDAETDPASGNRVP